MKITNEEVVKELEIDKNKSKTQCKEVNIRFKHIKYKNKKFNIYTRYLDYTIAGMIYIQKGIIIICINKSLSSNLKQTALHYFIKISYNTTNFNYLKTKNIIKNRTKYVNI